MCRVGADVPSKASAVLRPVPDTMITIAFPVAQPGRATTSWRTPLRSGVRWSGPAIWSVGHGAGVHATDVVVRGREEMLKLAPRNVVALSAAWDATVRAAGSIDFSSVSNCT